MINPTEALRLQIQAAQQSGWKEYANSLEAYIAGPGKQRAAMNAAAEQQRIVAQKEAALLAKKGPAGKCRLPECSATGWLKQEWFCDQHWANLQSWRRVA